MTTTLKYILVGEDKSASSALKNVGDEAEKAHSKLGKIASIAGGVFGGEMLTAATEKVGDFLKESVKAAVEDQQDQQRLALALKNTAHASNEQVEAADKMLEKMSMASGVSKDQLEPAYQRLVQATGSLSKGHKELSLAMDISAGRHKSLDQVSAALEKAFNGNVGALGRLGVKTKDAAGHTLALNDVLKNASQTFHGQAAAAANSYQGSLDRLHVTMDEFKKKVGNVLLPVLADLSKAFVDKALPAIQSFGDKIGPIAQKVGTVLGPLLEKYGTYIKTVFTKALAGARDAFDTISAAIQRNRPQLEQLGAVIKKVGGWLIDKLGPLVGTAIKVGFQLLGHEISFVIGVVSNFVDAIGATVTAGKKVVTFFRDLPGKISAAFGDAGSMLSGVGHDIVTGLETGISKAWHFVTDKLHSLVNAIPKAVRKLLGIASPSKVMAELGKFTVEGFAQGLASGDAAIDKAIGKVTGKVKAAAQKLADDMSKWKDAQGSMGGFVGTLFLGQNADGGPPTLSDILGNGANLAAQAVQYAADLRQAISMGLSKTSLTDLQSQGAGGASALHAIVGGGAGAIAQVNAYEAQQAAAYNAAGTDYANALYGSQVGKDLGTLTLDLHLNARDQQKMLLKLKRENGGLSLGLA